MTEDSETVRASGASTDEEREPPEEDGEDGVDEPAADPAQNADDNLAAEPAADPDDGPDDALPDDDALPEDVVPDVDAPGEDEEAVQPVELLVQLAKDGEIDPWDIDLMAVTDKFLARLQDADLRTSARALFYASVLLRMKGDDLMQEDEPQSEEPELWEQPPGEPVDAGGDPIESLETEMERRLERKRVRGQPETLEELVHELREAERDKWWKEARTYDTSGSPGGFQRGTQTLDYHADDAGRMGGEPTEEDVTHTTHEEDIETVIDEVRSALREHYEKGREEVLYAEVEDSGPSRVMSYLALLFLAHRGHVSLRQDELFGDLWVRDTGAVAGAGEVAAD